MRALVTCSWDNSSCRDELDIEFTTCDELVKKLEAFLEDCPGVEDFYIWLDSTEYFEWSIESLLRKKDLGDVWRRVKKDIELWLEKAMVEQGAKDEDKK